MKHFDITAQFLSNCLKKSAIHGLFLMFFVGCLTAQPMANHGRMGVPKEAVIQSRLLNCADLILTIQPINNGLGCCYRLLANNSNPDNCFGNISLSLNVGEFSNFTILSGWQFNTGGTAEYTVRPAIGFIPFGPSSIAEFCLSEWKSGARLGIIYDSHRIAEMPGTRGPKTLKGDKKVKGRDVELLVEDGVGVLGGRIGAKGGGGIDVDICVDCGKKVAKTQPGMQCDGCGFWHHPTCEKMDDDVYEFLQEHNGEASLLWYCKKCVMTSKKFMTMVKMMCEQQQQLDERV